MILLAPPVEALVYTTMPSYWANRPERAMDGDDATAFRTYHGMGPGDAFIVMLGRPVDLRSVQVLSGDEKGEDLFAGTLEVSTDGTTYVKAADFDAKGVAEAKSLRGVVALRLRTGRRGQSSGLVVREVKLDAAEPIAHALRGPGRGFWDLNGFDDLKAWAAKAEAQMESFWAETEALLYSDGFVPPNAVHVVFRDDKGLPPGMNGGGVMTVDAKWARSRPEDTGLTVHEMAHSVQSGGSPGWLVEATADYIRWIKFEPQNFTYRIDPTKPPQQPYRPGAAFLGWCELRYDPRLVTKLYDAARFGHYSDALFERYCGKPIDVLYKEFLADYAKDPKSVLVRPVPASMRPRELPVAATPGVPVDLAYNVIGTVADGARFRESGGFDEGGYAFSGTLLPRTVNAKGVAFRLGAVGVPNALIARGQDVRLAGRHRSLWLLASAVEGGQRDQPIVVTYDDGTTDAFSQNFSDWADPENFPGEFKAVTTPYRNDANGKHDERPFFVYGYGFPLDPKKTLRSVRLPNDENVRLLAMTLAD